MSKVENIVSSPLTNKTNNMSYNRSTSTPVRNNIRDDPLVADGDVTFAKDEKRFLTPYDKLLYDSQNDPRFKAEEKAGRRIGFYRILKDIGIGNFSRVKLGLHLLAKGKNNS